MEENKSVHTFSKDQLEKIKKLFGSTEGNHFCIEDEQKLSFKDAFKIKYLNRHLQFSPFAAHMMICVLIFCNRCKKDYSYDLSMDIDEIDKILENDFENSIRFCKEHTLEKDE